MSSEQLKTLIAKRGNVKGKVTRYRHFIDSALEVTQLEDRLAAFRTCLAEFEAIQSDIELLEPDQQAQAQHDSERESFENSYYELLAKSRSILSENQPKSTPISTTPPSSVIASHENISVKLPTINLPTFSGKYEDWLPFSELFQSLIGDNTSLSTIQKFHYLKSSLRGQALSSIDSLEITTANYDSAWNLLKNRYENKRAIVNSHVSAIFNINKLEKESGQAIRLTLDTLQKHLRALEVLGEPTNHWDTLLIHLIVKKLDITTHKLWENHLTTNTLPKLSEFLEFLEKRCNTLESIDRSVTKSKIDTQPTKPFQPPLRKQLSTFHSNNFQPQTKCPICKLGDHRTFQCKRLLAMSTVDRYQTVRAARLCMNCLSNTHFVMDCTASGCKTCSLKHNTLLHFDSSKPFNSNVSQPQAKQPLSTDVSNTSIVDKGSNPSTSLSSRVENHHVLLSTAIVHITDANGIKHDCRVLLDSGSQSNFVTKSFANNLGLKTKVANKPIVGIGQTVAKVTESVECTIHSKHSAYTATIECLVLNEITHDLPSVSLDPSRWKLPRTIQLADVNFGTPGPIDMLVGNELFFRILCIGQIHPHKQGPLFQKTSFGWVASGKVSANSCEPPLCHFTMEKRVDKRLEQFWEIEDLPPSVTKKDVVSEHVLCEQHFKQTTERDPSGQYVVNLPLKENIGELGESKRVAEVRFLQMESKLKRNPVLYKSYSKFMEEYEQLGHMEKVNGVDDPIKTYYIPHLPVIREDSSTTKLRVVFDASSKSTSGLSLNDTLMVGPTIQPDVFSILCRFRAHKYVLTADIEKMYRGILVDEDQRDLQRILWRSDSSKPIELYRLNTVTYGTAAAPWLAIRTLQELAMHESSNYPIAAPILMSDFYVDDLMTGAETVEDGKQLFTQMDQLLKSGGFNIRKWNSNSMKILESIPIEKQAGENPNPPHHSKVLGMEWNPKTDSFHFSIKEEKHKKITKRTILSDIATLFDPLGLLGPVILKAKLFLQELWKLQINWDESLTLELHSSWQIYRTQLSLLKKVQIDRHVKTSQGSKTDLHGFCDSSIRAYGACIYVRTVESNGHITVRLLCSKSKVSPLKATTIPRLELCGALLLVRLLSKVRSLGIPHDSCKLWCDSTIVLSWIQSQPSKFKPFVANRITEIQNHANEDCSWNYVRSSDNPADLVSRGLNPVQIVNNRLWWQGPDWLTKEAGSWPTVGETIDLGCQLPEQKQKQLSLTAGVRVEDPTILRFSSLLRLQRVTAFCLRFINNTKNRHNKLTGPLSSAELHLALNHLIKIDQKHHFHEEYTRLSQGKSLKTNSDLLTLQPFIDSAGLLRVGGRLRNANIHPDQKHPILLSPKSHLTELIVKHEHCRSLHAGPQLLLSTMRQRFWPLKGRALTRKIVHKCIVCFKANPKTSQPLMGDLPTVRTHVARAFTNTGADLCGPVYIRSSNTRNSRTTKGYIVVFVCLSTKAIHLELVSDMTTQSFLAAFKRFVSRRGACLNVYTDNGTNFVGADRELQDLRRLFLSQEHQQEVTDNTSALNIKWHFIPPRSPHFGGLWEAGVKSMKYHLKRCVGNASLTFEGMYTTLTTIEACLNSRPLVPLSNDPNDLSPLTPGHFLIGEPLTAVPEPNLEHLSQNRLSHWQRAQQITQHFWARWSKEYLSFLQQRPKWRRDAVNIKPGQLVVIKDDALPPLKWITARVIDVHPGADGRVRVATVKSTSGTYKRAANRLCVLPIDEP